ncbi:IclR family transcriptional regulator domain-containing protein [Paraburkholderia sp. 40]|uniref:IclR family transcriptional regulator domain-containing protein n=1 Tax=Paraburkholderia sp. 40 TaxID=2991059 RepID=UPI003D1CC358
MILSTFPKAKLAVLFDQYAEEIAQSGLGPTLDEFRASLLKIRRAGFYLSRDELENGVSALASPLFTDDSGEAVGSLAVIVPTQRLEFANLDRLVESIREAAARTSQRARSSKVGEPGPQLRRTRYRESSGPLSHHAERHS